MWKQTNLIETYKTRPTEKYNESLKYNCGLPFFCSWHTPTPLEPRHWIEKVSFGKLANYIVASITGSLAHVQESLVQLIEWVEYLIRFSHNGGETCRVGILIFPSPSIAPSFFYSNWNRFSSTKILWLFSCINDMMPTHTQGICLAGKSNLYLPNRLEDIILNGNSRITSH